MRAGGGCLMDLGVHIIDVVRGDRRRDRRGVGAVQRSARRRRPTRSCPRACEAARSWNDRGELVAVVGARPPADRDRHRRNLHLDSRTPLTLFTPDGARERVELPESTSSPLAELLAAIAGQRAPSVTAADGRAAVAVVEAAYHSAAHDSVLTEVD
jgi:predicted dehydrogenase